MATSSPQPTPPPRRLWNLLTARRTAAVLLLALLLVLLLGLWLPQEPHDVDAAGRAAWWAAAHERYGPRLDLYQRLGLTDIPGSALFIGLAAALLVNALCCTAARLGRLWREATRRPAIALPDAAYAEPTWQAAGVTAEQARKALRRRGARLHETPGPPHLLYSEGWRLAPLGTLLTHLGLSLLVLAALLHVTLASRQELLVPAGSAALEMEVVYDPGAGPFVAGGLLLTIGSALGLLFPRRRTWARLAGGCLQVRLGMEGPAAAEEIARLESRLGHQPGGRR